MQNLDKIYIAYYEIFQLFWFKMLFIISTSKGKINVEISLSGN